MPLAAEKDEEAIARHWNRLSDHLRVFLLTKRINSFFCTHYRAEDVSAMDEADVEELTAWIDMHLQG